MVKRKPYFQSQIHTNATFHVSRAIPVWYLSASGQEKANFQSQIHTNAKFHVSRAIPVWYLSASGQEKTVLSIANSHQCNIPCFSGHSSMVFECFWSRENRTFNRKFTPMQHSMSLGPFQYGI